MAGAPNAERLRKKAEKVSARFHTRVLFGLTILTALVAPVTAWEASPPQPPAAAAPAAATPDKPVDEAAAAAQESEEALRHSDGLAAVVNDTPISNYDVRQRVALFTSTSGAKPSADGLKQIRGQVLKQLETERLELLEAEKNKVTVSAADVDKAIANIMKDNGFTSEQLNGLLSHAGVRMETLRAQIAASIAWSKLVQDVLGDRVHVSPLDVDDEFARLKRDAYRPHYLTSEIFQAVDTPEQDAKVKKDMDELESQLRAGAPFSAVARQLSQNPTAAQGGDLGVVQEGQLAPELDKVLRTMRPGQISQPIRATGGYYILLLRELQVPEGFKMPDPDPQSAGTGGPLQVGRLLLPFGPKQPPKDVVERMMQLAGSLHEQLQSCEQAKEVTKKLPGSVYMNLSEIHVAITDLSAEMQAAIKAAPPGGSTEPMMSAAGIEIIIRCDKPVPKIGVFHMPSRDQVEQQIYDDQITTLARQYLRDLRRDADVEAKE
jgi:peptidyl-prolyl cis-trans isomerase SurA